MRSLVIAVAMLAGLASFLDAQWTSARPDGHAPIGVMLDHTHEAGEFMLSYRYMYMRMRGLRDGTSRIEPREVLAPDGYGFMVTPLEMPMQMHMFGLMFAPADNLTLVGMLPVEVISMDHVTRAGMEFRTESSGIGDFKLAGLYTLARFGDQHIHGALALSFPTGSIDARDDTPMAEDVRLPYPMQIGSGTYDLAPSLTYLGQHADWSWGGQASATFRLGENEYDYRRGHFYGATFWGAERFSRWLSGSLRLEGLIWDDVGGADPSLDPTVVPTADPDRQGGARLSIGVGANTYVRGGTLKGLRIAAECLLPFVQDLNGPQLGTDWWIILGAQYSGDTGLFGGE